jgi:hypothetical protein
MSSNGTSGAHRGTAARCRASVPNWWNNFPVRRQNAVLT